MNNNKKLYALETLTLVDLNNFSEGCEVLTPFEKSGLAGGEFDRCFNSCVANENR